MGNVTSNLGIGKGLEQCFEQADSQEQKLYKFKAFSKTRFASYAESCYSNFEKNLAISVPVLLLRLDSKDAKVRDTAARLLKGIRNIPFCATLCGVVDIYAQIAKISCSVQTVEQFPFEMKSKLTKGIAELREMSSMSLDHLDQSAWPTLYRKLDELKTGHFHGVELKELASQIRSQSDIGDLNCFKTVENRLRSLAKSQANIIESRTVGNTKHPYPAGLEVMAGCLDNQLVVDEVAKDRNSDLEELGRREVRKLSKMAGLPSDQVEVVVEQFLLFKNRLKEILLDDSVEGIRHKYDHLLFETHMCTKDCPKLNGKCPSINTVKLPLQVKNVKILQLFLKEEGLSAGIELFLSLYLQCAVKTHAEGVAESMGNYVDIHAEKRRGLDVAIVGLESYIHWNGPPVHLADSIGVASLDSYFAGRSHWRFVTKKNKLESAVVSRLKGQKAKRTLFE